MQVPKKYGNGRRGTGWRHWRWSEGTGLPAIGNSIDLEDAAILTEEFPKPCSCFPFLGGLWLSYNFQEVLLTLLYQKFSTPHSARTVVARVLSGESIERATAGFRLYICS